MPHHHSAREQIGIPLHPKRNGRLQPRIPQLAQLPRGCSLHTVFDNSRRIIQEAHIESQRVQLAVHPVSRSVAETILCHCREQGVGIIVLGHSGEHGILGLLKGSVTKKVLSDFRNMAVWVTQ